MLHALLIVSLAAAAFEMPDEDSRYLDPSLDEADQVSQMWGKYLGDGEFITQGHGFLGLVKISGTPLSRLQKGQRYVLRARAICDEASGDVTYDIIGLREQRDIVGTFTHVEADDEAELRSVRGQFYTVVGRPVERLMAHEDAREEIRALTFVATVLRDPSQQQDTLPLANLRTLPQITCRMHEAGSIALELTRMNVRDFSAYSFFVAMGEKHPIASGVCSGSLVGNGTYNCRLETFGGSPQAYAHGTLDPSSRAGDPFRTTFVSDLDNSRLEYDCVEVTLAQLRAHSDDF